MAAADLAVVPLPPGAQGLRGLRVAYVASAALLALLALATVASPLILPVLRHETATLPEAGKIQLLAKADEWVLQYNLINHTATAAAYTFELSTERSSASPTGVLRSSTVFVDAGRSYVFIYHLRPEQALGGAVRFAVRRGGESEPVEDLTLHLPPWGRKR